VLASESIAESMIAGDDIIRDHFHRRFVDGRAERFQDTGGLLDVSPGHGKRVLDGSMTVHQVQDLIKLFIGRFVHPEGMSDPILLFIRTIPQQMNQGERDFAFPEIRPERLTQPLRLGDIIQRVIRNLEGHSEVLSELIQGLFLFG